MSDNSRGFTTVELIIASLVFSIVALVALSGFIEIGRLFYKGATQSANQATARLISNALRGDIASTAVISGPKSVQAGGGVIKYYCVGNSRYTFILGQAVDLSNHDQNTKFGLLNDKLPGSSACANPFDPPSAVAIQDDAAELLGDKMRLNALCISPNSAVSYGNLYDVRVNLASGDDQYLSLSDDASPSSCESVQQATCAAKLSVSQYCANSELEFSVAAGSSSQ
ncbi:type II secretion system protein [Candidatus Saccharibacteria bacterium]|nr:type II secretion system protein [Candidatus Saccharibacteria bacterium]